MKHYVIFILLFLMSGCGIYSKITAGRGVEYRIHVEATNQSNKTITEQAIKVTQNKLKAIGAEGEISPDPDDPQIFTAKIFEVKDPERLKQFLFTSNQLELRKVVSSGSPNPMQTYPTSAAAQKDVRGEQEVLSYKASEDTEEKFVIVEKEAIVTGDDIRDASAVSDGSGFFSISFSLQPRGAAKLGDWTGKNINNYLAVILDKKIRSSAYIKSQIFDSGAISGRFTKSSAEDIALSLKSGYLPATMKILEEKKFGN